LLKAPPPVWELVLHLWGLGGGGERRLAMLVPEKEAAAVRCASREGGEERGRYSKLFIPSL